LKRVKEALRYDFAFFLSNSSDNPVQGAPLGNCCYKIRLAIRSKGKGKSGGTRVISFVQVIKEEVLLLSVHDQS
jgi:mRNA-degrading endonuclease RelE of RelBE toxin-antitoxin system